MAGEITEGLGVSRPDLRCRCCRRGGIVEGQALDGRPRYWCTACDFSWTKGKAGEPRKGKRR